MDSLFDQDSDRLFGESTPVESEGETQKASPLPKLPLRQEEMEAVIKDPAFVRRLGYWSWKLSEIIDDPKEGREDYSQEIFVRVMKEWKRTRSKRPDFVFVPTLWVKSIACNIIEEARAQKRAHKRKFLGIFGGPDGRLIDIPDRSVVPDGLQEFVLDEATKRFPEDKQEIILLLRKGFTYRKIEAQLEERWNPGTQSRSDPDFKKCSLGTISKVRKDFIAIAREIYQGVRFS
jgi:hypothetical protein